MLRPRSLRDLVLLPNILRKRACRHTSTRSDLTSLDTDARHVSEIPARSIRGQIASAIHVVIQVERGEDGRRRVTSISEIVGMEEDVISMQEIFRFRRRGRGSTGEVLGDFESTGVRPRFIELLTTRGIELPLEIFAPGRRSA